MEKAILLITAILWSCIATMSYAIEPPTNVTWSFERGDVTFTHEKHSTKTECSVCHHTEGFAVCGSCHGEKEGILSSKKALHNNCKGCHKEMKQGPTKCKGCHIK